MKKLLPILIFFTLSFKIYSNQLVLQIKCDRVLKGVTIDSRGDNKKTDDSIFDQGDIIISFFKNEIERKEPLLNFKWGPENKI